MTSDNGRRRTFRTWLGNRLSKPVTYWVYALLGTLLAPLWLLFLCFRRRLGLPLTERLGGGLDRTPGGRVCVLFHGASAGDVRAISAVASELARRHPEWRLVCTTQTRTGQRTAQQHFPGESCALPLEGWPWIDRFLDRLQPDVLVLEYQELWPRLIAAAKARGARVVLQNAHLNADKVERYGRPLWRWMLASLDAVAARSSADLAVLKALELDDALQLEAGERLHSKYALLSPPEHEQVAALRSHHAINAASNEVWIAAPLHADEFQLVAKVQRELLDEEPSRLLIAVPRYVTDGRRLTATLRRAGVNTRLVVAAPCDRSRAPEKPEEDGQSVLADSLEATGEEQAVVVATVGELPVIYGMADIAVIGGTFGARGGQNPVEAALAGCRVLVGPQAANISVELELVAAERVSGGSELLAALTDGGTASGRSPGVDIVERARVTAHALSLLVEQMVLEVEGLFEENRPGDKGEEPSDR